MIGVSPQIRDVSRALLRLAQRPFPVLILGETGTGKELAARVLHELSPWHANPFVPVDCGALAPTLLESELFGHIRGAFTGATQTQPGLFQAAHGGTLFLDEIAELPVGLQPKLLRALQDGEVRPIGSNRPTKVRTRIISATNQDLEAAVEQGSFRGDLYFRLAVFAIELPPLRERKSDIPVLVHHFINWHTRDRKEVIDICPGAMHRLMDYDWPGNVRELENCIVRTLTSHTGSLIEARDLSINHLRHAEPPTLREIERQAILRALRATGGDCQRAAKQLGIGKTTIYRKIKEYGISHACNLGAS